MFRAMTRPYIQRYDLVADKRPPAPAATGRHLAHPVAAQRRHHRPLAAQRLGGQAQEVVRIMAITPQLATSVDTVPQPGRTIFWSPADHSVRSMTVLSNADIADIVAFLWAITDDELATKVIRRGTPPVKPTKG